MVENLNSLFEHEDAKRLKNRLAVLRHRALKARARAKARERAWEAEKRARNEFWRPAGKYVFLADHQHPVTNTWEFEGRVCREPERIPLRRKQGFRALLTIGTRDLVNPDRVPASWSRSRKPDSPDGRYRNRPTVLRASAVGDPVLVESTLSLLPGTHIRAFGTFSPGGHLDLLGFEILRQASCFEDSGLALPSSDSPVPVDLTDTEDIIRVLTSPSTRAPVPSRPLPEWLHSEVSSTRDPLTPNLNPDKATKGTE